MSMTLAPQGGSPYPHLVADIGGTNARFGWIGQAGDAVSDVLALPTAGHATLADAARAYLGRTGHQAPASMAMGIATLIGGDEIRMTNHHWAFSIRALQAELGLGKLLVINDFTALALSLPSLEGAQLRQVGGGAARAQAPKALLGAGTGLGVSGLLPSGGHWVPLSGEGGHVTLSASNDREAAVIAQLRRRYGHASAERALSGAGLVALYDAVCALSSRAPDPMTAAQVSDHGLQGTDAACVEALELFCALLGTVAGNLALTLGAEGGVYIGGGIVPRLGEFFDRSAFRQRFEAKGRFRDYLAAMPVLVISAEVSPALMGAARALEQG
jgi:glucokinase